MDKIWISEVPGAVELGKPNWEGGVETLAVHALHWAQERRPRLNPDHRKEPLLQILHHRPRGQGLCHQRRGFQLAHPELSVHPLHCHHGRLQHPPHDHQLPRRAELPSKHPTGKGHFFLDENPDQNMQVSHFQICLNLPLDDNLEAASEVTKCC